MDKSLSKDYPTFTYNNETVIIKPGNQFHSNELRSRLHQMDIDAREIQGKSQLANLYNSTITFNSEFFQPLPPTTTNWMLCSRYNSGIICSRKVRFFRGSNEPTNRMNLPWILYFFWLLSFFSVLISSSLMYFICLVEDICVRDELSSLSSIKDKG